MSETTEQACEPWCGTVGGWPTGGMHTVYWHRGGQEFAPTYCTAACRDAGKSLRPPTPRQLRDSANRPWEEK